MAKRARFFCIFLTLALTVAGWAQGSAGGYGQDSESQLKAAGNFQGGMGGAGGGFAGRPPGFFGSATLNRAPSAESESQDRPEDEQMQGLWESKTAVLTPGDHYDLTLKMRKGETLLAGASSDAFDPALSVMDAKGKELFKNDDREEGDQSPFVAYRFVEAGTYTLRVLSYHSVAGGKFTLTYRSFVALDPGLGDVITERAPMTDTDRRGRVAFRIPAKKGGFYDLRSVYEKRGQSTYVVSFNRMVGPTGVEHNDFKRIPGPDSAIVFQALADGDYYVEYSSNGGQAFKTSFREVATVTAKDSGEMAIDLDPGELKIVEFPVAKNQIIRTTITGAAIEDTMSAPTSPSARTERGQDPAYGTDPMWTWFLLNVDSSRDVVRIFNAEGTALEAIRSIRDQGKQTVSFKNTESLPAWNSGEDLKSTLGIGESKLFLIQSTKSDLMRVFAGSKTFQPRLDIFRLDGELANSLSNRSTHTAGDDLYFPDAGTFVVRLTCDGFGGSGAYEMKRESLKATPYTLGSPTTMKLDGVNFGLYSVNLEKGKRYELMTDQPDNYLREDLLDEDGQFLVSQKVYFDKVDVQYFVPTRSGFHRLWLRGAPGVRHFKFQLHVPPVIGV